MGTAAIVCLAVVAVIGVLYLLGRSPESELPGNDAEDALRGPMRVMRMAVSGFVRRTDAAGEHEEALPASPYGEGELPTAIWGSEDGTIYVVGKLYSGQDGADHGAIYRRSVDGKWSIAHVQEGHSLHHITGVGEELYASGMGGVVYGDGASWRFVELPYSMVNKVWRSGDRVIVQAWDDSVAFEMRQGELQPIAPAKEPDHDERYFADGDTEWCVFDRSVELGEELLGQAESDELRAEFEAMQQAVQGGQAKVRGSV